MCKYYNKSFNTFLTDRCFSSSGWEKSRMLLMLFWKHRGLVSAEQCPVDRALKLWRGWRVNIWVCVLFLCVSICIYVHMSIYCRWNRMLCHWPLGTGCIRWWIRRRWCCGVDVGSCRCAIAWVYARCNIWAMLVTAIKCWWWRHVWGILLRKNVYIRVVRASRDGHHGRLLFVSSCLSQGAIKWWFSSSAK